MNENGYGTYMNIHVWYSLNGPFCLPLAMYRPHSRLKAYSCYFHPTHFFEFLCECTKQWYYFQCQLQLHSLPEFQPKNNVRPPGTNLFRFTLVILYSTLK